MSDPMGIGMTTSTSRNSPRMGAERDGLRVNLNSAFHATPHTLSRQMVKVERAKSGTEHDEKYQLSVPRVARGTMRNSRIPKI